MSIQPDSDQKTPRAKQFVYMILAPGDPTRLDPMAAYDEPLLYATREQAERELQVYIEENPDDDPPASVIEVEVHHERSGE
jgi:hypothetical protein